MKKQIAIILIVMMLFVFLPIVSEPSLAINRTSIINASEIGFGSQTRFQNLQNMTRNWLYNNNTLQGCDSTGLCYAWSPWFLTSDNSVLSNVSTGLHSCDGTSIAYTAGNYSNESHCIVTDELTRNFHLTVVTQINNTLIDRFLNTFININDSGNTYPGTNRIGGNSSEWEYRMLYNTSTGYWNPPIKDRVADTATDAEAYKIIGAALVNNSPLLYNDSVRAKAGYVVETACVGMVKNTIKNVTGLNLKYHSFRPGQTMTWVATGTAAGGDNINNGEVNYQAYDGPILEALAACRHYFGDTDVVSPTNPYPWYEIANGVWGAFLQSTNWTGDGTFRAGLGRSGHFENVSSGGTPYYVCDNNCGSGVVNGVETPDSYRTIDRFRAAYVWRNVTGMPLENDTVYAAQYASQRDIQYNATQCNSNHYDYLGQGYGDYADGGPSPNGTSGYEDVGICMSLDFFVNTTNMVKKLDVVNSHYSCNSVRCSMDSQSSFGVYSKAIAITAAAYGMGLFDEAFLPSTFDEGSGSGSSSSSINISVHSPANSTTFTVNYSYFNVTVWNNNNSNVVVIVNGTLPQNLYNSSFTTTPANDGWALNSWVFSSDEGGIINNTADSGNAAWTQNLNLSNMTNGYNITLNMSLSNFTNAKIFFGTNSGTQDGDRILIERNGDSVNIKHDGGAFGSFTVPMKQYVIISVVVNLSANTVNVSSGASKWGDALANGHLAVNGSFIAFVPGQNMSTVNQNSTGWKISNINVTNTGKPFNVSSSTSGNSTMNVTIRYSNGTLIYQKNGTLNGTDVSYNLTGLSNGVYNWTIFAVMNDGSGNNASVENLTFTINVEQSISPVLNLSNISEPLYSNQNALFTAYVTDNNIGNLLNVTMRFFVNATNVYNQTNLSVSNGTTINYSIYLGNYSAASVLSANVTVSDGSFNVSSITGNTTVLLYVPPSDPPAGGGGAPALVVSSTNTTITEVFNKNVKENKTVLEKFVDDSREALEGAIVWYNTIPFWIIVGIIGIFVLLLLVDIYGD